MNCGRCGHDVTLHGRRGYGACRHGHESTLAFLVDVVRAAVAARLPDEQIGALLEKVKAEPRKPCACLRFRKRAA
jgi:hypothetical protein